MAVARNRRNRTQYESRVDDVTSFLHQVTSTSEKWLPSDKNVVSPWFRGQGNSEWPLVPKFYRECDQSRNTDDEVREEFAQRGPAFCQYAPSGDCDWYFLMQHHGAPTRLLDWTDGALIALYFAVRDSTGLTDAAVWMLDPYWLNRKERRCNLPKRVRCALRGQKTTRTVASSSFQTESQTSAKSCRCISGAHRATHQHTAFLFYYSRREFGRPRRHSRMEPETFMQIHDTQFSHSGDSERACCMWH